jgi:tetratricopeptide (TPR) repeat protein
MSRIINLIFSGNCAVYILCFAAVAFFPLYSCATVPAAVKGSGGNSLMEAIEKSADRIAEELPQRSRVAIVAFESDNASLSEYIMEELTGALLDRKIEVADRQNLEYVFQELNFNMSGNVSDESSQSIGKFLGAQLVITGQLRNLGRSYRFMASAIHVETATRASVPRVDVQNDHKLREIIAALNRQTTAVKTVKYGITEQTLPQTAGTFLDRGLLFASRGDYQKAIADFSEAIRLNPNLTAAYTIRSAVYINNGNYALAIADLEEILRFNPNDQDARRNLDIARQRQGR